MSLDRVVARQRRAPRGDEGRRHCEERSDEAIQKPKGLIKTESSRTGCVFAKGGSWRQTKSGW
ncbi:MAG TPA: hypothetical protein ENJ77_01645, partial [Candidatus Moranbacteria bacterium]|nr:hypothetical protein [Candidatus Moranbacteria bacterium]